MRRLFQISKRATPSCHYVVCIEYWSMYIYGYIQAESFGGRQTDQSQTFHSKEIVGAHLDGRRRVRARGFTEPVSRIRTFGGGGGVDRFYRLCSSRALSLYL